jgi:anti-sigma factor RsiW
MNRWKRWFWRYVSGVHPGMERLVLWADGVPCPDVEAHLAACHRCSRNAALLRAAVAAGCREGQAGNHAAHPVLDEIFDALQEQMRAWRFSAEREQHWGSALEFYFGKKLARQGGSDRIVPASQVLFNAFLGRRAADALARQISGAAP